MEQGGGGSPGGVRAHFSSNRRARDKKTKAEHKPPYVCARTLSTCSPSCPRVRRMEGCTLKRRVGPATWVAQRKGGARACGVQEGFEKKKEKKRVAGMLAGKQAGGALAGKRAGPSRRTQARHAHGCVWQRATGVVERGRGCVVGGRPQAGREREHKRAATIFFPWLICFCEDGQKRQPMCSA